MLPIKKVHMILIEMTNKSANNNEERIFSLNTKQEKKIPCLVLLSDKPYLSFFHSSREVDISLSASPQESFVSFTLHGFAFPILLWLSEISSSN